MIANDDNHTARAILLSLHLSTIIQNGNCIRNIKTSQGPIQGAP